MSLIEARRNRDAAVALVAAHASASWQDVAYRAVVHVATWQDRFTSDDIWEALAAAYPGTTTREPRAMGPVLMGAVRAGVCRLAGCDHCGTKKVMTTSRRSQANGMDTPVYESLLR